MACHFAEPAAPPDPLVGIEPRPETVAVPHPAAEDLPFPAWHRVPTPRVFGGPRPSHARPWAEGSRCCCRSFRSRSSVQPASPEARSRWRSTTGEPRTSSSHQPGRIRGRGERRVRVPFFSILIIAVLVYRADDLRKAVADSVSQFSGRGYDPDKIQQTLELLKTPQGLSLFVGFVLFIMCVIFIVGASIGGAWYSAWVRKRLRR